MRSTFAREILASFDWDAERRRFEQLVESDEVAFLPSAAFTDDAGRTLELGPNSDETFWVIYRYSTLKSTFGFCPVDHEHEHQLEACEFDVALDLVERHYASKHFELVSLFPAQEGSDHETI